jgi:hypothetical protein
MKHIRSLYRSPLKTGLTLLLLAAAAFLFLYNLSEYSVSDREYREARGRYEGVLTIDSDPLPMESMNKLFDYFLHTDPTNPAETYGAVSYGDFHQPDMDGDTISALLDLPHVTRPERRYMTAGVSPEYVRLDTDPTWFPYNIRCILAATVKNVDAAFGAKTILVFGEPLVEEGLLSLTLTDWELLAGDPDWLMGLEEQQLELWSAGEEWKGKYGRIGYVDFTTRLAFLTLDPDVFVSDALSLTPGRRYVFVLRNCRTDGHKGASATEDDYYAHMFFVGDDFRKGWWPYFTDVTDLPEGWLDTEDFAPLRELIRVTNDDVHTFDVIYGDDMTAIRRVAEGRIVCDEGRFLSPADAGQPVCVVNSDVLEAYGLKVGDKLTLDLGNYLCEQYAPLGAVASTRGRHATAFTRQEFTIVGAWRDLNEGKHALRERYWCYSNNSTFVPAAFLPECVNGDAGPKPGEISFVVGNAEEILPFVENCLPRIDAMGLTYQFSDGGWLEIADELMQAKSLALVKLLVFAGAALFALILTVWLFIGRKRREYGILRALGMPRGEAANRLLIPFLILGAAAALAGTAAARIVTARQLAADHAPAPLTLFLLGALGFLVLLALIACIGLLLIRRRSVLELIREKRK